MYVRSIVLLKIKNCDINSCIARITFLYCNCTKYFEDTIKVRVKNKVMVRIVFRVRLSFPIVY